MKNLGFVLATSIRFDSLAFSSVSFLSFRPHSRLTDYLPDYRSFALIVFLIAHRITLRIRRMQIRYFIRNQIRYGRCLWNYLFNFLLSFPSDFCVQRLTEEMRVSIYYLCCLCLSLAHKKEVRHDIVSEMWLCDWGLSKNFRYVHVLLTHSMNFIHLFFIRLTRLQDSNTVAHSKQPTHTDIFLLRKYMLNYIPVHHAWNRF